MKNKKSKWIPGISGMGNEFWILKRDTYEELGADGTIACKDECEETVEEACRGLKNYLLDVAIEFDKLHYGQLDGEYHSAIDEIYFERPIRMTDLISYSEKEEVFQVHFLTKKGRAVARVPKSAILVRIDNSALIRGLYEHAKIDFEPLKRDSWLETKAFYMKLCHDGGKLKA